MEGNSAESSKEKTSWQNQRQLSIEKACEEYKNSVKCTVALISHQLNDALTKNCNNLEELAVKIAARTNFLEKNPSFLSCLVYHKRNVKCEPLLEFDEIRIALKEHSKRIHEKIDEIETHHQRLFDLILMNAREERVVEEFAKIETTLKEQEEEFVDCLEIKSQTNVVNKKPSLEIPELTMTFPEQIAATPKSSFDVVTIQKNAYSDASVDSSVGEPPCKYQIFPDIHSDVSRRKPQEDLHGKLIKQLVDTDSLEGFIKLMDRKPIVKRKQSKIKKEGELERKYTNSLWFFSNKPTKKEVSKPKFPTRTPSQKSTKSAKHKSSSASTCCSLLVTSSQPCPVSNQERTRGIRQNLRRTRLRCYDLLDDIDHSDLQPIKSEYPRRDNIFPMKLHEAKTYLHRMMHENEKVWKKLLQPIEPKKKLEKKKSQLKAKNVKNLIEYLTAPEQKYLSHIPQSLIVMPVKIIYDNFPTKDNGDMTRSGAVLITDLTKAAETRKVEGKLLQSKTETKIPESKSFPFPMHRKKEMLAQLRGLKLRNDNIQHNIQKAIDVIESKMIDLLSSPNDATNSEAFNAMELEITNVLKMMNEGEKQKEEVKEDKTEPEKDVVIKLDSPKDVVIKLDSPKGSPKVRKEVTTVTKPTVITIKQKVGGQMTEIKKTDPSGGEQITQIQRISDSKKSSKDEKNDKQKKFFEVEKCPKKPKEDGDKKNYSEKVKATKLSKLSIEDGKKAANIEEGERLLDQVDSVIKKIDNIYTKFYDDTKTKNPRHDANFSDVINFFDGLTQIIQQPPILIDYKYLEETPLIFYKAPCYFQTRHYYMTHLTFVPTRVHVQKESSHLKEIFFPALSEPEIKQKTRFNLDETTRDDQRHNDALKAFYTLFFSSIFVALNFNYAS